MQFKIYIEIEVKSIFFVEHLANTFSLRHVSLKATNQEILMITILFSYSLATFSFLFFFHIEINEDMELEYKKYIYPT